MWVHEMEAIEKAAYGFVKLTPSDFVKLGITKKSKAGKCEACSMSVTTLTIETLSEKNRSKGKLTAFLCTECKRNNSNGRSVPKGWEDS